MKANAYMDESTFIKHVIVSIEDIEGCASKEVFKSIDNSSNRKLYVRNFLESIGILSGKRRMLRMLSDQMNDQNRLRLQSALGIIDSALVAQRDHVDLIHFYPFGVMHPRPKLRFIDNVHEQLRQSLKFTPADPKEISIVVTPIMLSLCRSGHVSLPADPYVFAVISLLISYTNISSELCMSNFD